MTWNVSHTARLRKTWFPVILVWYYHKLFLPKTFFLLKPFEFCYFLSNLVDPASIVVVWFCSFMFIFSLFFSNKILKPTFCPMKFWKMLSLTKFVIIYSDSFISCRITMGVCKNRSSLNNRAAKYLLRVFKGKFLKNIRENVHFFAKLWAILFKVIRYFPSICLLNLLNSCLWTNIFENI